MILRVRLRTSLKMELLLKLRSISANSSSSSRFGFPFGSVVEDVQASAAGGNDISNELGTVGADITQRAAMSIQVGELLLN